jgi:carbonic anhydrase
MTSIRQQSSVLQNLEAKGAIKIVGGMYNLDTALIEFLA